LERAFFNLAVEALQICFFDDRCYNPAFPLSDRSLDAASMIFSTLLEKSSCTSIERSLRKNTERRSERP